MIARAGLNVVVYAFLWAFCAVVIESGTLPPRRQGQIYVVSTNALQHHVRIFNLNDLGKSLFNHRYRVSPQEAAILSDWTGINVLYVFLFLCLILFVNLVGSWGTFGILSELCFGELQV